MKSVQLSLFSFPEFFEDEQEEINIIPKESPPDGGFKLKLFDLENIKQMMPKLYDLQAKDVLKAEVRFFERNMKGMLFTNGTGSGKTIVGLGIIKRFLLQGKDSILVIVPTDQKCKDWIEEGKDVGIEINQLENTSQYSKGINVTTYSNFYQNDAILGYHLDLIIYDESHYLLQNQKGEATVYFEKHKKIAKLPTTFKKMYWLDKDYYDSIPREQISNMFEEFIRSTKVVFFSASPFAYVKSLLLGDGTLWPIMETDTIDDIFEHNRDNRYDNFFVENFGYRIRYNRLTEPESGVDMNLMERMFYEKWKREGAISGRQIDIDRDYSREFVLLNSEIGNKIDEGVREMTESGFREDFPMLTRYFKKKWTYHFTRQLLENIKAGLSISRIEKHIALGRKVVVFHDYNVSSIGHPFRFTAKELITKEEERGDHDRLQNDIDIFSVRYPHLWNLDISNLKSPLDLFYEYFGDKIAIYNGKVNKKKRSQGKDLFNSDKSDVDVILIQRKAGKEGISLHDVTGKKQRVLMELGLPMAPTDCIQVEGRIYRIGSMTNAIYEYLTIQTAFERMAYAQTIAERSRTAENLSMGEKARNMEMIFKEGYQNPITLSPYENQGVGGKESDNSLDDISEFQKSISYYYTNLKKTYKSKSVEGVDYFATPEPIGLKMVEWMYSNPGDRFLEPSAGHGAIARFFPVLGNNTYIESSYDLCSKLRLNIESGEVMNNRFEDLSRWNKYDKIVMNPPFGVSGKTAEQHLRKAIVENLNKQFRYNTFSRLICILPNGNSMNARLRAFNDDPDFFHCAITHEILLPTCAFQRAGTTISTKIIVVDMKKDNSRFEEATFENDLKKVIDLTHCKDVNELFTEIETIQILNYGTK